MTKKALVEKIVHWLLIYIDMEKSVPFKDVMGDVQFEISTLAICMARGCTADAARLLQENRSTLAERIRLKGQATEEEIRELCAIHSVDYHPRNKTERAK